MAEASVSELVGLLELRRRAGDLAPRIGLVWRSPECVIVSLNAGWCAEDGAHALVENTWALAMAKVSRATVCGCEICVELGRSKN